MKTVRTILMYKTGVKLLIFSRSNKQLTTTEGKALARGTNSRLPLGVYVIESLRFTPNRKRQI